MSDHEVYVAVEELLNEGRGRLGIAGVILGVQRKAHIPVPTVNALALASWRGHAHVILVALFNARWAC
jgi:hypothetical protein